MKNEKLQKVLARAGVASRRTAEKYILDGRITINGQLAKLGDRVDFKAEILFDGKPVRLQKTPTRVLLYHKPIGEVCTRSDEKGRKTVFENLPKCTHGRWISIGRLDLNTSGVLLFTNDGALANRLMHPSAQIEREYAVRILGRVDKNMLARLTTGVTLEDGPAKFTRIKCAGGKGVNVWYHVVLTEGRNREVRRLWESQGVTVSRLIRIRFGNVTLPRTLKPGSWIDIDRNSV
jgi:23S rRNA pseudouridine2605 synthase